MLVGAEALDQQHRRPAAAARSPGSAGGSRPRRWRSHRSLDSSTARSCQLPPIPLRGSQSSGVPVCMPPNSSRRRWMRCSTWSASSSSISGPRRRRPGPHGGADLDAGRAAPRRAGRRRREHRRLRRHGGADQAVVDASDPPGVERRLGAHHEHLAGAQRAGDLVGPGQQAAQPAGQRTDRGHVGSADEAHRPAGGGGEGEGGEDRGHRVAAVVDDDQRPGAHRQVVLAADDGVPPQPAELDGGVDERRVATPVVDLPGARRRPPGGRRRRRPCCRAAVSVRSTGSVMTRSS